jgi:internalin A
MSDAGITQLAGLANLRSLNLSATHVSSTSMSVLGTLPNLEAVWLNKIALDRSGLQYLTQMARVHELSFACAAKLTPDDLRVLGQFRSLNHLEMEGVPRGGLVHLAELSTMQSIRLQRCTLEEADIRALHSLPQLTSLALYRVNLNDDAWEAIGALTALRTLNVGWTNISDRHLIYLTNLLQQRELDLEQTKISDEGAQVLATMTQLEVLNLDGTRISPHAIAYLARLQALEQLSVDDTRIHELAERDLRYQLPNTWE